VTVFRELLPQFVELRIRSPFLGTLVWQSRHFLPVSLGYLDVAVDGLIESKKRAAVAAARIKVDLISFI
jgi:hypothetical protein